jgi:hypothetical protein
MKELLRNLSYVLGKVEVNVNNYYILETEQKKMLVRFRFGGKDLTKLKDKLAF